MSGADARYTAAVRSLPGLPLSAIRCGSSKTGATVLHTQLTNPEKVGRLWGGRTVDLMFPSLTVGTLLYKHKMPKGTDFYFNM